MNYLAHFFLSGDDLEVKIGNFLGDFVKGSPKTYSIGVLKGIELHREIDRYTDSHPVTIRAKKRLYEKYRHYSSVIIDIFYDHFLAKDWHLYSSHTLSEFADSCYIILNQNIELLPEKARYVLPYMKSGNWLVEYGNMNGMKKTLTGMSKRASFNSKMNLAVHDLEENYQEFQSDFDEFFPDIQEHCKKILNGR